MNHFYNYFILFRDKTVDYGIFSTPVDLAAGYTEENVEICLNTLCEQSGLDFSKRLRYGIREFSHQFMEAVYEECNLRGFGDKRSDPGSQPDSGSSDGQDSGDESINR